MNQYIITEEQTKGIYDYFAEEENDELRFAAYDILKDVLAHPYNPQAEQENLVRMILIEIIDYIDAGYEADEIQKIYEEKFDIKLRQSKDEFVATGCGGGVKRILGDSGIRLKWKEDKDGE